jgi:hypothetical protein
LAMGSVVGLAFLSSEFEAARFPNKLPLLVPLLGAAVVLGRQTKGTLPIAVFGFLLGACPLPILLVLAHIVYGEYPALQ